MLNACNINIILGGASVDLRNLREELRS